ncbi:MAG: hypothetical protein U0326_42660 [Polyangiales bacterium]
MGELPERRDARHAIDEVTRASREEVAIGLPREVGVERVACELALGLCVAEERLAIDHQRFGELIEGVVRHDDAPRSEGGAVARMRL